MKYLVVACAVFGWALTCGAQIQVNNTADSGPGTLRQAILDANGSPGGDVIQFVVTGSINLVSPLPAVTENVSFTGPGAAQLTIRAGGRFRPFVFSAGTTNSLSALTVADGVAVSNSNGGAISNAGDLTITGCAFANNQCNGGWGGAIYNCGKLTLANTLFSSNQVHGDPGHGSGGQTLGTGGGGAGLGGAVFSETGGIFASNCTFLANSATGGSCGPNDLVGDRAGGGYWGGLAGNPGQFGGGGGGGGNGVNGAQGGFGGGGGGGGYNFGGTAGFGGGDGSGPNWSGSGMFPAPGFGGGGGGLGGGVFVKDGPSSFANCTFAWNRAIGGSGAAMGWGCGGGVFVEGSSASITSCAFTDNRAGFGGAVFTHTADLKLDTSMISGNVVDPSYGSPVAGNSYGGGFAVNGGTFLVNACTVSANSASGVQGWGGATMSAPIPAGDACGGGLYVKQAAGTITSCLICSNSTDGGPYQATGHSMISGYAKGGTAEGSGVMASTGANVSVVNTTLFGNTAAGGGISTSRYGGAGGDAFGAGIAVETNALLSLTNVTIAANVAVGAQGGTYLIPSGTSGPSGAASGGGLYALGTVRLFNTLVAHNSGTAPDVFGAITTLGNNLIGNAHGINGLASSDILNVDPMLGPLANNGGSTLTCALLPGSLAVDNGGAIGAPSTDQRGIVRPKNAGIDIGAYELDGNPGFQRPRMHDSGYTPTWGSFHFTISGTRGAVCEVFTSPNLTNWTSLGFVTNTTGSVDFIDKQNPGSGKLYYRVTAKPVQ